MPIATTLNLAVTDYKDANHWYWRLTDADGHFLADQEVRMNSTDSEYDGFLDLPAFLAVHAAPDRRREDEARLVRQVGEWMGRHFYGAIGDKMLSRSIRAIGQHNRAIELRVLQYGVTREALREVDELCRLVEHTEGVRFREFFSRLPHGSRFSLTSVKQQATV